MNDNLPTTEDDSDNYDSTGTGLGLDNSSSMSTDGGRQENSDESSTSRRGFVKGLGLGAVGTGVIGTLGFGAGIYTAEHFYDGGDTYNSSESGPNDDPSFSNGDSSNSGGPGAQNQSDGNTTPNNESGTDNETDIESPGDPEPPSNESGSSENETDTGDGTGEEDVGSGIPSYDGDTTYEIDGQVEVDLDSLDSVYEDSSVVMGVQDDGDLIAWNTEVENDDGYNPLWRFSSSDFPNREFFDVEGEHPVEEIYAALDEDVQSLSEGMVSVFYDGDDWESESDYKEIGFEDLKNGLLEYGNPGQAQDYFFNRSATLNDEEPVLETEWQELLQDGL